MAVPQYEQYIGKSKEDRRELISGNPALERKRFFLSRNPEIKKRIAGLKEVLKDAKERFPEIIGFSVYGSLIKGYAEKSSDIDLKVFFDRNKLSQEINEDIDRDGLVWILNKLAKTLSLGPKQITNVNRDTISKDEIKNDCQNLLEYYDPIFIESISHRLTSLFFLSIGTELQEYRRVCLETLSAGGEKGEMIWKKLMEMLHEFENKGFSPELKEKRLKLYPKTLAEGKKYFLHQNADIE